MRYSLRNLIVAFSAAAIIAFSVQHYYGLEPVHVTSTEQWSAANTNSRCVLFVNGDWNSEMATFKEPFNAFSRWAHLRGITPLTFDISESNEFGRVTSEALWEQVPGMRSQHGLKHLHGAGRVVWIENGKILDYDWCANLTNWKNLDDTSKLKERTRRTFR